MSYKIHKGRYYYDLGYTFNKLKKESDGCFVCGSKDNLEPHHLKQVKPSKSDYSEENNLVVLCNYCHHNYHSQYKKVNPKTFAAFVKKASSDKSKDITINQLRKNNKKLKNENFKLKAKINEMES